MLNQSKLLLAATLSLSLTGALPAWAQERAPEAQSSTGWRKFGEPQQDQQAGGPAYDNPAPQRAPRPSPPAVLPEQLMMPAGTWITARVNQPLSSNHNIAGDTFTATLSQPLVVNGFVVARRGQTLAGRVADSDKGGRVKGTSRLGLEITELSLTDGQQLPLRSQLIQIEGGTSHGRDATAVATTTGVGAAIGAVAAGGIGAGIGAAAGAVASTVGVLVTRGHATEIYPEQTLTFRTLQPVAIATDHSGQAFQPVGQRDFEPRLQDRAMVRQPARPPMYWGGFGYPYPYWGYSPYFYGPSFGFYGGGYYGGRYYGGGYRGGGYRGGGGGHHR